MEKKPRIKFEMTSPHEFVNCNGCLDEFPESEMDCEENGKKYCVGCADKFRDLCKICKNKIAEKDRDKWFNLNGMCLDCWEKDMSRKGMSKQQIKDFWENLE